ncbi:hypothetical protein SJAG_16458 [Schizosaccharomyces japonicus yFS275]|uniref:Retrotransposon gag domain-containing protein n=1 Tax=Schizosaccharomyces japonicus (strain yFS275 / FY16936) TaxID=402676 RepID=T0T6I6_SCHJY|nr:hypothetical protein SJAG_16458 [Schizosaccharomyces japonicus yFS275]EQC53044.1 hypothetical protein SJAG_16458 [Schizosaccharomyces japonicus yFS275]
MESVEQENAATFPEIQRLGEILLALTKKEKDKDKETSSWVSKPAPYRGQRDLRVFTEWIKGLERFFRWHKTSAKRKAWMAFHNLTGEAASRCELDTTLFSQLEDGKVSWEAFKAYLRDAFIPTDALDKHRRQFYRLRQTGSVHEFVDKVNQYQATLGLPEWAVMDVLHCKAA